MYGQWRLPPHAATANEWGQVLFSNWALRPAYKMGPDPIISRIDDRGLISFSFSHASLGEIQVWIFRLHDFG
jgi:hypothetical protein